MRSYAWLGLALAGVILVAALVGWVITERSRLTADIRENLRAVPLDASCDADGNMIDSGSVNCVDIEGRYRIVHSRDTKVYSLNTDTKQPAFFARFSADESIDGDLDAMVQFKDAAARAARQQAQALVGR